MIATSYQHETHTHQNKLTEPSFLIKSELYHPCLYTTPRRGKKAALHPHNGMEIALDLWCFGTYFS